MKESSLFRVVRGEWLVVDTETTGLGYDAEVVQVAVVNGKDGRILLDTLICPYNAIPKAATAIHGITNEMVSNAPTYRQIEAELRTLLQGVNVVAYNANFDERMLAQSAELYDLPAVSYRWYCAMKAYQKMVFRRRWCKLGEACAEMGVKMNGAHWATADALATRDLVLAMVGR
jgi:DNA polymerase III epsilon subunit-like protein